MKSASNFITILMVVLMFTGCTNGGCSIQPQSIRVGDADFIADKNNSQELAEKRLIEYVTERTVRITTHCQVVNTKTGKIIQKYKERGWGTGTILVSTKNYSLIQTAAHVTKVMEKTSGDLKMSCDKFFLEKRDSKNNIIKTYGKVSVYKKDIKHDIAVLMVPYNMGVSSKLADTSYIGQRIRLLGYPHLRGVSGTHLSYASGHIMTLNIGKQKTWNNTKGKARFSAVGYFGNSGGAVWNSQGQIVGIVTSMIGFRTLGGYVPQHGSIYGLDLEHIKKFYVEKQISIVE